MRGIWYWRPVFLLVVPILLLPIVLDAPGTLPRQFPDDAQSVFACLYVVAVTVAFWVSEVVPLPVTAFLPLILFPFFGILEGKELATDYFKDTNFVLVGSFMVAAAFEEANLHKRMALRVLLLMGSDPRWLLLGFLLAGGVLSMWLANAAVVAMLLPPAFAIMNELALFSRKARRRELRVRRQEEESARNSVRLSDMGSLKRDLSDDRVEDGEDADDEKRDLTPDQLIKKSTSAELHIYRAFLFTICYSSNIGGTGTLTGTPPTIVLKGLVAKIYPNCTDITYPKWMGYAMPSVLVALALTYLIMVAYVEIFAHSTLQRFRQANLSRPLRRQYEALGPMRFEEFMALMVFVILFLVWFFRDPGFPNFTGWASVFPQPKMISIGSATMSIAFLLFIIPKQAPWAKDKAPQRALLTWPVAQRKIPWGVLLLVGGGYAMASAITASGLSKWIGARLSGLHGIDSFALMMIGVIMAGVMTEFTSNVVVVEVMVPILGTLAQEAGLNPLYLILPAVMKSSFAFMLPVATPPNALVFSFGLIKVYHMMGIGLIVNIMCVGVIAVQAQYYGLWFYSLGTYPGWAPQLNATTTATTTTTALATSTLLSTSAHPFTTTT